MSRKAHKSELQSLGSHAYKANTPVMGGLLVIFTVAIVTYLFDWSRNTLGTVAVMLISALFGALDDLMSIFGRKAFTENRQS